MDGTTNSRSRTVASIVAATCTATRRESGGQPHVDERPVDEVTESHQAAIEKGARGSPQPHVAFLDRRDGKERVTDQVAELVREKAQALVRGSRELV
jgi:hypothetical protein